NDIDVGRGNLDHVLVGPGGIYLLESKWLSGVASVSRGVLTVTWPEDPDDGYENTTFARRARTDAALVACHMRDRGMPRIWVQPVIVLWANFDQDPVVSDGVAWLRGKQLADALLRQPIRLSPDDIGRATNALRSLGTDVPRNS